jgi:hypothetical protein
MFHRQENAPRALRFFQETHHISTKLQSVNLKLYDMMYIADCMKHMSLTQEASRWYAKFISLAGGVEKALETQVICNAPEWAELKRRPLVRRLFVGFGFNIWFWFTRQEPIGFF